MIGKCEGEDCAALCGNHSRSPAWLVSPARPDLLSGAAVSQPVWATLRADSLGEDDVRFSRICSSGTVHHTHIIKTFYLFCDSSDLLVRHLRHLFRPCRVAISPFGGFLMLLSSIAGVFVGIVFRGIVRNSPDRPSASTRPRASATRAECTRLKEPLRLKEH